MKVHLVDGTYELFRTFYGAPSSVNAAGREVGASKALFGSMLKLLRDTPATHVAVAFDHVIESFRNDLFDGYKTGDGIDPALFGQFELAERVCQALGVLVWPMIEFEADDAIATAAFRLAEDPRVEQVVICSPDKDLTQCVVAPKVVLWDRLRDRVFDDAGVKEKFGVAPQSIPDFLALVGDTADGIPGIPGWGQKSASTILSMYQRLEAIPESASSWTVKPRGADKLSRALEERRKDAYLYRTLATLRTDVPIDTTLDALAWKGPDAATLADVVREIGGEDVAERARRLWAERGTK